MEKNRSQNYLDKIKQKYDGQYVLGLDIGTNSVGWAVMDEAYRIPLFQNKKAFGSRLFDAGETAEDRRLQRGMRRRLRRRENRIQYLQEVFMEGMERYDANFFAAIQQLKKSTVSSSDYQELLTSLSLQKVLQTFDGEYKTLLEKYPTMYHVRKAMMQDKKADLRLVYLALHHIVRKRGHFIHEGLSVENLKSLNLEDVKEVLDTMIHVGNPTSNISLSTYEEFINILKNKDMTRRDRIAASKKLSQELDVYARALLDTKFKLETIFELENKASIKFSDADLEQKLSENLSEEQIIMVEKLNEIFMQLTFSEIIGEHDGISEAKIAAYDTYGEQLKMLKKLLKPFDELRKKVLKTTIKQQQFWEAKGKDDPKNPRCILDRYQDNKFDMEEFYKELTKVFEELEKIGITQEQQNMITVISDQMAKEQFLEKLNTTKNSSIPNQLHLLEARKIIDVQKRYYPEIFTDENIKKIESIITFRIPYYVGPLIEVGENDKHDYAWLVKKSDEPIRPWNFEETVDLAKSAENFIMRMVGTCTYIIGEHAMPKASLYYQLFEVLNEINVIKIDGEPITMPLRNELLSLFLTTKKVSITAAEKHLQKVTGDSSVTITGTSNLQHFNSSLSTWIDMNKILHTELTVKDVINPSEEVSNKIAMIEKIILWKTVFPEGNMFSTKVQETYPEIQQEQVDALNNLRCSGWGRLSKKLITELPSRNAAQQNKTVLELLYSFTEGKAHRLLNFQQIITRPAFEFSKILQEMNAEKITNNKITYKNIDNLAGSPALKRGIWQSILVMEEIVSIFGQPRAVVIETAKSEEEKRRTTSRKDKWEELQKKDKDTYLSDEIKGREINYRDDRLWLYLLQDGKCMYTGQRLNIDKLSSYQVDHIIPFSISNDNSIDNKVLVLSHENQRKSDSKMPLEIMDETAKKSAMERWENLKVRGRMSERKYFNLTRERITPELTEGFINRQLVETRQITKHVIDLITQRFQQQVPVIGLRAEINDRVKKDLGLVKIRGLNDKHHAVDAYMAAFIYSFLLSNNKEMFVDGQVKWQKIPEKTPEEQRQKRSYYWIQSLMKKNGLHSIQGEVLATNEAEIYNYITKEIDDLRVNFTRKTGTSESLFWNENYKKTVKNNKVSEKEKLGLYDSIKNAGVLVVEVNSKKNEKELKLINLPIYIDQTANGDKTKLIYMINENIGEKYKLKQVIEKGTAVRINGSPFRIVSEKEQNKDFQLQLTQEEQRLLKWKYEEVDDTEKLNRIIQRQTKGLVLLKSKIKTYYEPYFNKNQMAVVTGAIEEYCKKLEKIKIETFEEDIKTLNEESMKTPLLDKKTLEVTLYSLQRIYDAFLNNIYKATKSGAGRVTDWVYAGKISSAPSIKKAETFEIHQESVTGLRVRKIKIK